MTGNAEQQQVVIQSETNKHKENNKKQKNRSHEMSRGAILS